MSHRRLPNRRMRRRPLAVLLAWVLVLAVAPATLAASGGDDPGDAPTTGGGSDSLLAGETIVVTDQLGNQVLRVADGHDLDQYLYQSSGPLEFSIVIEGDFGPVELDGSPAPGNQLYGRDVRLTLRVFDVDDDYPGTDVEPEADQVVVNGNPLPDFLSGADGQWSINTFVFSSDYLQLPTSLDPSVSNDFQVLIDTANGNTDVWAVEVDWAELRLFDASVRPVALLHGLNGDAERMAEFQTFLEAFDPLDGQVIRPELGPRASTEANAVTLIDPIHDLMLEHNAASVDVVAHSKGGLDTRRFIMDNAGIVSNLVMLGTPNGGSQLADFLCGYQEGPSDHGLALALRIWLELKYGECHSPNDAIAQLQTHYVQETFNRQVPDRPGIRYWTLAGTKGGLPGGLLLPGEHDGTVSVESVEWLSAIGLHTPADRYEEEDHSSLVNAGSRAHHGSLCILYRVTCATLHPASLDEFSPLQGGDLVPTGDIVGVEVPANDDTTVNVDLESSSTASVTLLLDTVAEVEAELDNEELVVADLFGVDVLSLTTESAGAGVLDVTNTGNEPVEGFAIVAVEADRQLTVSVSETLVAANGSVDVTVEVSQSDTGDDPHVVIIDSDGNEVDDFDPPSVGPGVWEESLDPIPGGFYTAAVFLDGDRPRMASTTFTVSAGAAELDGGFAESTVDDDSNSLFDALMISPEVEVTTAGTYHVALTLEDGLGNPVAASGGSATLGTGSQVIPVRVEGADLFASRTSGPYEVVNVVLSREDGDAVILEHELASLGSTDSYDFDEFEHFPVHFDLDGFSDDLVDTNSDQAPDELQVDGSVWVDTAGTYAINARLLTGDGTELVEFQTTTSLTSGDNGFQLIFPWATVQTGGVDGPYTVADLSVYPTSSADVLGYLPVAHYTAAYEVVQTVSYSYDFLGDDEDPWEEGWAHFTSDTGEYPFLDGDQGVLDGSDVSVVSLRPETVSDAVQQLKLVFDDEEEEGQIWGLVMRSDGSGLWSDSGYYCLLDYYSDEEDAVLYVARVSNGEIVVIDDEDDEVEVPLTTDVWLKCEIEGSDLRAKVWDVGDSEPGGWDLEVTDSTYPTGRMGIMQWAERNVEVNIDDYSLEGYESEPVQSPDPGGGDWYTEEFTGNEEDPWPAGWTHLSSDNGEPMPYLLGNAGLLEGEDHQVTSLRPATNTDSEQLLRVIWNPEENRIYGLAARHDGEDEGDQSAYYCFLTYHEDFNDEEPTLAIVEYDEGDEDVLDDVEVDVDTNQWLKCVIEGNQIKAKVWAQHEEEPQGWDLEVADNTLASGRSGTLMYGEDEMRIDDYRLGPG